MTLFFNIWQYLSLYSESGFSPKQVSSFAFPFLCKQRGIHQEMKEKQVHPFFFFFLLQHKNESIFFVLPAWRTKILFWKQPRDLFSDTKDTIQFYITELLHVLFGSFINMQWKKHTDKHNSRDKLSGSEVTITLKRIQNRRNPTKSTLKQYIHYWLLEALEPIQVSEESYTFFFFFNL